MARAAMTIKAGIELALSSGDIPAEFFDPLTCDPSERDALAYRTNVGRREAAAFASLP